MERALSISIRPTTLLQIFREIMIHTEIILKSIIGPDDTFILKSIIGPDDTFPWKIWLDLEGVILMSGECALPV